MLSSIPSFETIWQAMLEQAEITITVALLIVLTIFLAWGINRSFTKLLARKSQELNNELTNYKFLQHMLVAIIYLVGFGMALYLLPVTQHIANTLLAGAGILAIAVGFASQQALGNIISGIFIVMFKPYRINDRVTLKMDMRGVVEDINLRHTVLRNFENQRIIIPNSVMSSEILINSNYTDEKICRFIEIGISYGSDIDKAKAIMADEVANHKDYMDVRKPEDIENGVPPVTVRVLSLGESSVNLRAWAWAKDAPTGFVLSCDLHESIKKRFDREGIVIPFPQRTISYLNPKQGGD
jgi:small-conductance mechanosensitive channel